MKTIKIDLNKSDPLSDKVRAMRAELEGEASVVENGNPQWPTRFITYQKLAPSREKPGNK